MVEGRIRSWLPAACLLILVTGSPLLPASGAQTRICLRETASVRGPELVLADVADVLADEPALAERLRSVPLGPIRSGRLVSQAEVRAAIRMARPEVEGIALEGALQVRASLSVRAPEPSELSSAVKEYVSRVGPWRPEEIEVLAAECPDGLEIPAGETHLRVTSRGVPTAFSSMLLPVEASNAGGPSRTFWVKARVRVRANVVRVIRNVPCRGVLDLQDLEAAECEIRNPRAMLVRKPADAAGMITKKALAPGDLLSTSWVEKPSLVHSGETVRLTTEGLGINATTVARALQTGRLGDFVRVRNLDSNQAVRAQVTGPGEVKVKH